jgi:signal transduction histidine kinase
MHAQTHAAPLPAATTSLTQPGRRAAVQAAAALALAAAALAGGVAVSAIARAVPAGGVAVAVLLVAAGAASAGWALGRRSGDRAGARLERRAERDRRLLRETAARAFRAQETERMRIARELQEETAQTLSALLLHLQIARMHTDAEARAAVLEEIRSGLVEATDTVRRFARGLYPPALNDVGLVAAVQSYADTLSERGGPRITVVAGEIRGLLTRERELALYRVLQEALGNAVRHAGARDVEVRIAAVGDRVLASVVDDGTGFDVAAEEAAHPCLGLFGMRERALYAGGSASVESEPGRGTRVAVELPVARAAESGAAGLDIVARPLTGAK